MRTNPDVIDLIITDRLDSLETELGFELSLEEIEVVATLEYERIRGIEFL